MSDETTYTTAIIAAVPATDDPVHAVVAEDAHITLQFLGEADGLSEDQINQIEQSLEMLAGMVYPFEVDISGTAELGPDKAQVLIVQSALLTKIRETLGLSEAVSTAVASVEQFPNWIPHLTLAYEGEMPDVSAYEQVTIGSLELWLAEEHRVYPLAQPKDAVTAAGIKEFEEGLHPRGADGRFIEKFGVIKYLTGLGWQYGKVEGIYHDKHTDAVKLTITPSDLSGVTHGDSIVLNPKQVYRAPTSKAHLPVSALGVTKVGGQGGSNPGGLYEIPKFAPGQSGQQGVEQFYVKKPKTKSHGNNEALANALYEEAGVPVPEVDLHPNDGQLYSKIIKGQPDMAQQLNNPEWTDQVRRNFAVDAWLGNRDVFGLTYDNILTDANGVPWRIDNGGALLYRAMGEKKTDFGGQVTELDAFRQGKKAKIFGPGMTKAQELDGAERVLAISPGQIDDLVAAHNLPKSLADTLKARRAYIASYYGLQLPESKAPLEAEGPTSAPLVDSADIAENKGKTRNWFKASLIHLGILGQAGDTVEFPDGSTQLLGVDETGNALSIVGEQMQQLKWLQEHGHDAPIFLKKQIDPSQPRPDHGQKLMGSDLASQRWKRGDEIIDSDGVPWKVLGWNDSTGAVLVQFASKDPILLDTFGKDINKVFTVNRWDPPAVDTPEPVQTEQQATSLVDEVLAKQAAEPSPIQTLTAPDDELTSYSMSTDTGKYEPTVAPVQGKTGQAAVAETQIKADLDQPLPVGNGSSAPAKTSAPGGAKTMVIGDGTEAATGDSVTSKKDGKTYTFVKPKGQYAVVTDPNSDTPDKQLLKLASTMTQPGKVPAGDVEVEAPKTATGEIPALGMQAVAKDGWAGEITLISPDGKFVFITDANGTRKRKSTGTVSVTSAPKGLPDAPKTTPGPVKSYGPEPTGGWTGEEKATGWLAPDAPQMHAGLMVHVGYADGSDGLEPYSGQPLESLETNSQGKIAVFGDLSGYLGPVSSNQMVTAAQANNKQTVYQVLYTGNIFFTDGTTGPSGGLVLWYSDDNNGDVPGNEAWEAHSDQPFTMTIIGSETAANMPLTLPEGTAFQAADETDPLTLPAYPPLYGDEAKTLTQWKGQLSEGSEISLDGHNWLTVKGVSTGGSVTVQAGNGQTAFINPWSSATYVVKAPDLVNGDAPNPAMQPTPELPGDGVLPVSTGKKKIGDLTHGDVVIDGNGDTSIIDSVTDVDPSTQDVVVKSMDEDWGSPADPNFEFTHLGNLTEGPVSVPIGMVAPHLYPGAKVNLGADHNVQLVSYPELLDNGNYRFAVIPVDDPEGPMLVTVGDAPGADINGSVPVPTHLDAFTTWQEAGADSSKINALFDAVKTESQDSTDHHAQMTDQGIPFGSAQYPIYFNEPSGTYFRAAHHGLEEWNADDGTWNQVFGTVEGKTKVWEGAPYMGKLVLPAGFPADLLADSSGNLLDYKPKPGETIQVAKVDLSGPHTMIISYPFGLDGPAHSVIVPADGDGLPKMSVEPFQAGWKDSGVFTDITTIHDPFADTVDTGPTLPHHEGPQPPPALGAKLQTIGFTPEPGAQLFYAQFKNGPSNPVFLKGDDGRYRRMGPNGSLSESSYTLDELADPSFFGDGDWDFFTWTYLPAGADAPTAVAGLPQGFAPYVPSGNEALLKVTLPSGKTNVYLQKQPGAGWYEMGSDGTVNESSDAVKSDHVVQLKLAGKGSQAAKYELLHPQPEGTKKAGAPAPELSSSTGKWTPEPTQKVVALLSYPGDEDPWFYVQNAPGEDWTPSPNTPDSAGTLSDASVQGYLNVSPDKKGDATWKLIYDGPSGQSAVDTPEKALPSFTGYTPKEGEQVFEEPNGSHWVLTPGDSKYHPVNDDGTLDTGFGIDPSVWASDSQTKDVPQVWPTDAAAAAPATAPATPQTFGGYTPDEGEKVIQAGPDDSPTKHFYVQQAPGEQWKLIGNDGQPTLSAPVSDETMQSMVNGPSAVKVVYEGGGAAAGPGGNFAGYQTGAGDSAIELTFPGGDVKTLVKKDGSSTWNVVMPGGALGNPDDGDAYSQDTLEWVANPANGYSINVLQGTIKPGAVTPEPLTTSGSAYAGVSESTFASHANFGTYEPQASQSIKLLNMATLQPGESVYALEDASLPGGSGAILKRNSDGTWNTVYNDGSTSYLFEDDEAAELYIHANNYTLHKGQFGAPTQAPAAATTANTYAGPPISGWQAQGVPDPASFGYLPAPENAVGLKTGDWLYVQSGTGGLFVKLAEDVPAASPSNIKIAAYVPVKDGATQPLKYPSTGNPISFNLDTADHIYAQNYAGAAPAPGAQVPYHPSQIPLTPSSAPSPAVPSAPSAPAYPGAKKPSQEDINAWGGDLTKDGHIPTAQMFVTGKGPMSGKIVSVSKDKTKATVLKADGTKTTRLISALKTDQAANYQAYGTPAASKIPIPAGMALAVDTPEDALSKTLQDGKFRAIVSDHPGVLNGEMTVTAATAPSGKKFNRIHLTLTDEQRGQLVTLLSGSGEKGDWATSSKLSEQVAIGDQLPMRLSSTANPDGSPRWKVDPSQVPPTHTVTKVENLGDSAASAGSQILLVTMKNNTTGEIITSRFHTGKSLTTYTWDPNKPKKLTAGAFVLSATAKAQGWSKQNDGVISAVKPNGMLDVEPGNSVSGQNGIWAGGQGMSATWEGLRNVTSEGVVIEITDPKGSNGHSNSGFTVISVPEGMGAEALNGALAKMGIDYAPMTQEGAKKHVRGLLRNLIDYDGNDVETPKHYTDDMLFSKAGQAVGISDLGWQDVSVGVDESTGKVSYFWSTRVQTALAGKVKHNLIYRAAATGDANAIAATVKYGTANAMMKRSTGMIYPPSGKGVGASPGSDNSHHAGHGGFASAMNANKLPTSNHQASYKSSGMMVYMRPEAVLGRIMDYRVSANKDAFGEGEGKGSNNLKSASSLTGVKDYFLGGGLPSEAISFIAVNSSSSRTQAIKQLHDEGIFEINGRPIEEIVILQDQAGKYSPKDLPMVAPPANARPILDLPASYDAPAPAGGGAVTADASEDAA